jgi:hypothetical protein
MKAMLDHHREAQTTRHGTRTTRTPFFCKAWSRTKTPRAKPRCSGWRVRGAGGEAPVAQVIQIEVDGRPAAACPQPCEHLEHMIRRRIRVTVAGDRRFTTKEGQPNRRSYATLEA